MKVYGNGYFIGMLEREGKDGKKYTTVNCDFDNEVKTFSTSNPERFRDIPKFTPCVFEFNYQTFRQDGKESNYLAITSAKPNK